jgi:hypothetical protein
VIDGEWAQIGVEPEFEGNVFADQAGQEVLHILRHLIEAQRADLRFLRPGENQQLADQAARLDNGRANLIGIAGGGREDRCSTTAGRYTA